MDEKLIKKMNDILNDYINYLNKVNPIFLQNAAFFCELNSLKIDIKKIDFEPIKMNAFDTFNLIKKFYARYHPDEIEEVEKLFNGGVFNIHYRDELEEEKIYLTKDDIISCQRIIENHPDINISLSGDIWDYQKVIHEIRHQLNQPINGRSPSNDNLTEGISIFDEFLALDFINEKLENVKFLKNNYIYELLLNSNYISFICKLINIKEKLGLVNLENYELLYGLADQEEFIDKCNMIFSEIDSYKEIKADEYNWYTFGVLIAMFMYKKYKDDKSYLEKIRKLNQAAKENLYLERCLEIVNIDLYDDDIIEILKDTLYEQIKLITTEEVKKI